MLTMFHRFYMTSGADVKASSSFLFFTGALVGAACGGSLVYLLAGDWGISVRLKAAQYYARLQMRSAFGFLEQQGIHVLEVSRHTIEHQSRTKAP
jgi:hypothetical protein